jgi:hypothetical protein
MLIGTGLLPLWASPEQGDGEHGLECLAAVSPEVDYLAAASVGDQSTDSAAMSLARIGSSQAHEVGHTLGFTSTNFAASQLRSSLGKQYVTVLCQCSSFSYVLLKPNEQQ